MLAPIAPRRHPTAWIILLALFVAALLLILEGRGRAEPRTGDELPILSHPPGRYEADIQLHLQSPVAGGEVYFTLDGQPPDLETGVRYQRPIHLRAGTPGVTVLRARVHFPDGRLGPVLNASYVTGVADLGLPVLSLIVNPDDFWGPERGIYAHAAERGRAWERPVDVTFVDLADPGGFHLPAGLRIHGRGGRLIDKKGFRLYFRSEYGSSRLEYPVFDAPHAPASFKRLVIHNGGQDTSMPQTNWTLLRNQLVAELAAETHAHAVHSRPVLLFINGEPWGLYQLRERIDEHFLADHFGTTSADILDTPEEVTSDQVVNSGDRAHWDHLTDFLTNHSLADPDHYAYVQTQVDLANFIDYQIIQIYIANEDWPHHNTRLFRPRTQGGRWQWILWDTDRTLAWYPGTDVNRDLVSQAQMLTYPGTSGRQTLLLRRLLENPDFRNRFLVRLAVLLNGPLSPGAVTAEIDTLAAVLVPAVPYEEGRWPVLWTTWATNIEELRDFARRRPDIVRRHAIESFALPGSGRLTLRGPATGSGGLDVSGFRPPALPWEGIFFQGTTIEVTAVPEPGYRFDGWVEFPDGDNPLFLPVAGEQTLTPRFAPLPADAPRPDDVVITGYGRDNDGHWVTLQVVAEGGTDLRGWRLTDNDHKLATDEGSLILPDRPQLAAVPSGTSIRLVDRSPINAHSSPPPDEFALDDGRLTLYTGNGTLDNWTDPWFNLGETDNLVLLAPGPTAAFDDDVGIDFLAVTDGDNDVVRVTPATFGILRDGIRE